MPDRCRAKPRRLALPFPHTLMEWMEGPGGDGMVRRGWIRTSLPGNTFLPEK